MRPGTQPDDSGLVRVVDYLARKMGWPVPTWYTLDHANVDIWRKTSLPIFSFESPELCIPLKDA